MTPLGEREVRVLAVDLAREDPAAEALLAQDERARAARFVQALHGRRFARARAALRRTLGAVLDEDPAALAFAYAERGKPGLPAHPGLAFNLSHSGDRALVAVTWLGPVGVDVEEHRDVDHVAVGERTFSAAEVAALRALPAGDRRAGFFRVWTRKEAVVKARGLGLYADLAGFDVPVEAGARGLRAMRWPDEEVAAWTLADLDLGPVVAGAVAVAAPDARVVFDVARTG